MMRVMLIRTPLPLLLVLLLATVALVACGGDDDDDDVSAAAPAAAAAADAHDEDSTINVTFSEWSLKVDEDEAHAGEVVFSISNGGAVPHELVVVSSDLAADALPTAGGMVDETQVNVIGRTAQLAGAGTSEDSFSLEAGSYVLICNIPAHYDLGMWVAFTVE